MKSVKACAEFVANRMILEHILLGSAQFSSQMAEIWEDLYPQIDVPHVRDFESWLWSSTRQALEVRSILQMSRHAQQAFVCERFIQFHLIQLGPQAMMLDLRKAVSGDMLRIRLPGFDDSMAMLAYQSRRDPNYVNPGEMDYTPKEKQLITEMYQWIFSQYVSTNPVSQVATPGSALERTVALSSQNHLSSVSLTATETDGISNHEGLKNAIETTREIQETPKYYERRPRGGSSRRRSSPEELEAKTLVRIRGQLAIDLLLMNGEVEPS